MQVKVADRQAVVPTQDETRVVSPQGLQQLIDQSVQACPSGDHLQHPRLCLHLWHSLTGFE